MRFLISFICILTFSSCSYFSTPQSVFKNAGADYLAGNYDSYLKNLSSSSIIKLDKSIEQINLLNDSGKEYLENKGKIKIRGKLLSRKDILILQKNISVNGNNLETVFKSEINECSINGNSADLTLRGGIRFLMLKEKNRWKLDTSTY